MTISQRNAERGPPFKRNVVGGISEDLRGDPYSSLFLYCRTNMKHTGSAILDSSGRGKGRRET
jgi:hypothetical protein